MKQRKTGSMLLIAALLIAIIGGNLFIFSWYLRISESDARTINKLGIIRGLSQRSIMLTLEGIPAEPEVSMVSSTLNYYLENSSDSLNPHVSRVAELWDQTLKEMEAFKANPDKSSRHRLTAVSEKLWGSANAAVLSSQFNAEKRKDALRPALIIIVFEIMLAASLLFLIAKVVRSGLEKDALFDPLTGCYNRRVFDSELEKEIKRASRYGNPLSLILFDIDYFKKVNDNYGHSTGDVILKELSALIRSLLRETDLFARVGGEEFAVLAPHSADDAALKLSEKLRESTAQHSFPGPGKITCSFGVSTLKEGETKAELYSRTDKYLYRAKDDGRNRVCGSE